LKPARVPATLLNMTVKHAEVYPELQDDQMLAIGIYGETVAAYRYTVLAEKVPGQEEQRTFAAIADEEQAHKQMLQRLFEKHFPGSAFALSDQDKALVLTGPRLINVRDLADYREVLRITLATELRTTQFYEAMRHQARNEELREVFTTLAEEGFQHYQRLLKLGRERGLLPPEGETSAP
jgi:rubrerythrin